MSTSSHLPPVPNKKTTGRRPAVGRYVTPVGSEVSLVGHYGVGSYSAVPNLPGQVRDEIAGAEAVKAGGRATHRIDPAHALASEAPVDEIAVDEIAPIAPRPGDDSANSRDEMLDGESLLHLHGAELIEQLRAWAGEIDARQAQLNAQQALHELQVRQFRTWRGSEMQQIEEERRAVAREREALRRERDEVQQERSELMRAGRRLAAAQWASGT